jgi:pectinesterase
MPLLCAVLFSTALHAYETEFRVSLDGSGDFDSIQAAVNASKSFPDQDIRIFVGAGVYEEKVVVWAWNTRLSLIGVGRDATIIRWNDHFDKMQLGRNSTFHTATLRVDADDFYASDLSIENSAGPVGQAIALSVDADRVLFERVALRGHQDTLYLSGENKRVLLRNCLVEGTVDFIFGGALAVLDHCDIHSMGDGYITAASTAAGQAAGIVIVDSRLTAEQGVSRVYLGRPWRDHAQTVFLNCEMGPHILSAGWDDWGRPEAHRTTYYAEFSSHGKGGSAADRVDWSKQLSAEEAARFKPELLLSRPGERDWFKARDRLSDSETAAEPED